MVMEQFGTARAAAQSTPPRSPLSTGPPNRAQGKFRLKRQLSMQRAYDKMAADPRLVVNNYPPAISLIEFAAGALKRQSGAAIEFDNFYLAYREHCTAKNARALAPAEAVA